MNYCFVITGSGKGLDYYKTGLSDYEISSMFWLFRGYFVLSCTRQCHLYFPCYFDNSCANIYTGKVKYTFPLTRDS